MIGSNPVITYNSVGSSGKLNLDYSTDGGAIWNTISKNEPDDGDYGGWIVPNAPSTNCKIKISDVNGYATAISNVFTISSVFTEQTSISLPGISHGSAAWGDYDNDGYLDILLTGVTTSGNPISQIYHNSGNNTFTQETSISLPGISYGSAAWGDYDNDGFLDILLTGSNCIKYSYFKNL